MLEAILSGVCTLLLRAHRLCQEERLSADANQTLLCGAISRHEPGIEQGLVIGRDKIDELAVRGFRIAPRT